MESNNFRYCFRVVGTFLYNLELVSYKSCTSITTDMKYIMHFIPVVMIRITGRNINTLVEYYSNVLFFKTKEKLLWSYQY